jgi:hypothetical protein
LPGVLNRRTPRAATATAALVALISVSGCSAPAKLDQQEKVAFARACTSLIERNVAQAVPPVKELDNQRLDLNDPAAFYATLERLRGPGTYNFDNPKDAARSPKDMLDTPCQPQSASRK